MSIPTNTTVPAVSAAPVAPVLDLAVEAARVGATMRLAFARVQHPELVRAEAEARRDLAAAIMAMDEAEGTPGHHNMNEQMTVEMAQRAYGRALADLVRGEASS